MIDVNLIRRAILSALSDGTSNFGTPPEPAKIYLPRAHIKSLNLEANLVIGSRGVGKSFWTSVLGSPELRKSLSSSVRHMDNTEVRTGFALNGDIKSYPDGEAFAHLIEQKQSPYNIWRAVVGRCIASFLKINIPSETWLESVQWVRENPEDLAKIMEKADEELESTGKKLLILFDALDRSCNDWQTMDMVVRDLLKVILWLKSYSRIHGKVFLREDQLERTITDFPDSSKLLATKTELTWQHHDLHGLLWQILCNAPDEKGEAIRNIYGTVMGAKPDKDGEIWQIHQEAKTEGELQRSLFQSIAGAWMGKDRRRGVPYIWSVRHLADGKGLTSPRSFLAAIKEAAEDSIEHYPSYDLPLHYESIKRGVARASQIRIEEIAEDYPWVTKLLRPLKGILLPCPFNAIEERWVQSFPSGIDKTARDRLPPQQAEEGWKSVLQEIETLGIVETMRDNRINMPDLYRIGFGLGRKGGVKPKRKE